MKQGNKKKRNLFLLLILLLSITVGFALLSTTLFINGSSTIKGNTWDIHWDSESVVVDEGSVTVENDPTVTADTISFAANFDLPGDYYEFTVDAVNAGTIDGIIKNSPAVEVYDSTGTTKLTGNDIPTDIICTITYADGTAPSTNDILAKRVDATHPTKQKYKIRVEFNRLATELPDDAVSYMFKFSAYYEQYKAPAAPAPTSPVTITASKTTASVNEEVKITVSFTAAAYNLQLSGAITDNSTLVGGNLSGENTLVTQEFTLPTTTAGTYTVTVSGDITLNDGTPSGNTIDDISQSVTVTVQ